MRLRPFILCFNRTAISIQKIDSKSSVFHSKLFSQISSKSYRHNAVPNRFSSRFSTSRTNGPRSLSQAKVCTHSALLRGSHTRAHTAKQGAFQMGGGITTLGAFHTFRKPCVAGYQNGKLCRFWALVGGALEEHRKPSEQRCAYACRCPEGVAAPPGCVIFSVSVEIYGFTPRTQGFLCVRGGGGITTPGVRCVLPKFSAPACQSSLFAVF